MSNYCNFDTAIRQIFRLDGRGEGGTVQTKPLREEVIRLRQVQNAVDTALRRREQPQEVQRKKHEMEL